MRDILHRSAGLLVAITLLAAAGPAPSLTPTPPERGDPAAQPRPSARATNAVNGTRAAEMLAGTPGNDAFRGGGGADTLAGGPGDDTYYAGADERVVENPGEGTDTIIFTGDGTLLLPPNVENVVIGRDANRSLGGRHMQFLGNAGGPSAIGNALANVMQGSAADNMLDGRGGNDYLTGGAGRDSFVFGRGWGHDRVTDFRAGEDRLRLVSGFRDFSDVRRALRDTPAGALLTLGEDSLLLEGMPAADLREADVELPPDAAGFALTFGDEFNGPALDRFDGRAPGGGVWRTRIFHGEGTTMGDHDGQAFVDRAYRGLGLDPFQQRGGTLRIQGSWQPALRQQLGGREFASGVVTTEGSFVQQYGFFEARMRLSDWPGGFPAFWLLPSDHSWPPEIDVMEQVGNRPGQIYQMGHTEPGLDTTGWHVFGLHWTPQRLAWFVDGRMTHVTYDHHQHKPMYLILNHALGGTWAGAIRRPDAPGGDAGAIEVDWVRGWGEAGSTAPAAFRPAGAPLVRFSLAAAPGESWGYRAASTGRLLLRPGDLGLASLRGWADLRLTTDRAADSWQAEVNNGWAGLNLTLEDADGGRITANNLTVATLRLGGASVVTLDALQAGSITTGDGNDEISLPRQRQWVAGQGFVTEVRTGAGDDRVTGWAEGQPGASLRVEAGPGNDVVQGSSGDDVIAGGPGDDILTGGPGRDSFVFRRQERGADTVTDFTPGADTLVLEGHAARDVRMAAVAEGWRVTLPEQVVLLRGLDAGAGAALRLVPMEGGVAVR